MVYTFDDPKIIERGKKIIQKNKTWTWKFQKMGAKPPSLIKGSLAAVGGVKCEYFYTYHEKIYKNVFFAKKKKTKY